MVSRKTQIEYWITDQSDRDAINDLNDQYLLLVVEKALSKIGGEVIAKK